MLYEYFRFFNWINTAFGVRKPFLSPLDWKSKSFSFVTATFLVLQHFYAIKFHFELDWKDHMEKISSFNNMLVNVIIIIFNAYHGNTLFLLYETFDKIISKLNIREKSMKMFGQKFYFWVSLQSVSFIPLVVLEIAFDDAPYVLLIRMPIFSTLIHLIVHLCLILSVLKVLNHLLVKSFEGFRKVNNNFITVENGTEPKSYAYYISTDFHFTSVQQRKTVDLKMLCNIYDELCTGLDLLEICHGLQIVAVIWLMFSGAVMTVTLVANNQANILWLEVIRGSQIFLWFICVCYVDDKIRQQVEKTDLLIIKYLIDFQADPSKKGVLQTFRVLVNTNRLQFYACNLYHVNFTTLLGTVWLCFTLKALGNGDEI